jgi:hypothetical protein
MKLFSLTLLVCSANAWRSPGLDQFISSINGRKLNNAPMGSGNTDWVNNQCAALKDVCASADIDLKDVAVVEFLMSGIDESAASSADGPYPTYGSGSGSGSGTTSTLAPSDSGTTSTLAPSGSSTTSTLAPSGSGSSTTPVTTPTVAPTSVSTTGSGSGSGGGGRGSHGSRGGGSTTPVTTPTLAPTTTGRRLQSSVGPTPSPGSYPTTFASGSGSGSGSGTTSTLAPSGSGTNTNYDYSCETKAEIRYMCNNVCGDKCAEEDITQIFKFSGNDAFSGTSADPVSGNDDTALDHVCADNTCLSALIDGQGTLWEEYFKCPSAAGSETTGEDPADELKKQLEGEVRRLQV